MSVICRVKDLTFRYFEGSDRNVLRIPELSFNEGEVTVVLGASGCGKSTLAAVMCGLYPENGGWLESGTVEVAGRELSSLGFSERTRYISQMFQNPDLQFCMRNLREELYFCMENRLVPTEKMKGLAEETAAKYGVSELLDRPFSQLSGGEKQKAALCCLFLTDPKVMVLDEPFANLDDVSEAEYLALLRKKAEGERTTIIAIDHRAAPWKDTADSFLLLGPEGRPLAEPVPAAKLGEYRQLFLDAGLNDPVEECDTEWRGAAAGNGEKPAVIEMRGVSVRHRKDGAEVLTDVDLTAREGEMVACLGRSGGGKTSLFMTLLGQKKYTGSIKIRGRELHSIRQRELFSDIGIVFQNPANQFVTASVIGEVETSLEIRRNLSGDALTEEAMRLLGEYELEHFRKFSPFMLSQGQQRRLGVLTMLAGGQRILLLDEPTYGQDGRTTEAIMRQMTGLAAEGVTVIFSTHDRPLAAKYADRVWRVEGGTAYEER